MDIQQYISNCYAEIPELKSHENPWDIIDGLRPLIERLLSNLSNTEFEIKNNIAIHKSAIVEANVAIKEYSIIGEKSLVKSGAYLRDSVYIGKEVSIGANCEVKQSIIFNKSRIAHLNYVGNSIIGEDVNLEAGSILANHFNEYKNRSIRVVVDGSIVDTKTMKFGALLGDCSRIGANAVLNPGTILKGNSVVGRLTHVDQLKEAASDKL